MSHGGRKPLSLDEETGYKDVCEGCQGVKVQFAPEISSNFIVVHAHRPMVAGKKSKEKATLLHKLLKIVSAFRNSGGGVTLVHLEGQESNDRCLEYFDEFITDGLTNLIGDGQLYTKAYRRNWLSDIPRFKERTDFIILTVSNDAALSTVDFNTKVKNDIETRNPTYSNIANILFSSEPQQDTAVKLRGLHQGFFENRNIEFKAFQPRPDRLREMSTDPSSFTEYIWNELRLKGFIVSFSTLEEGGSYYVGVSETQKQVRAYKTKVCQLDGIDINYGPYGEAVYQHHVSYLLKEKVLSTCVLLRRDFVFVDVPSDLIEVFFHPLDTSTKRKYVLEVAVRCCDGIIFYDKRGPAAYEVRGDRICRMAAHVWLEKFISYYKK